VSNIEFQTVTEASIDNEFETSFLMEVKICNLF